MSDIFDVNAHLHTPYSFSAFDDVTDALDRAAAEGVKVVGINDFYSTDGYREWYDGCAQRGLFPLMGIEMIALNADAQRRGIRVNDPNNPGRTYLSGKGLAYPVILTGKEAEQLRQVREESNRQVARMCAKLNGLLDTKKAGFRLDYDEMVRTFTRGSLRERHLAKALRLAAEKQGGQLSEFYAHLCGRELKSDVTNAAGVENELRSHLLKAGGAAFVPEEPAAFLPVETVCSIIRAADGIPTYPFLADDAKGCFTDFEGDLMQAADTLRKRGIPSVEFITTRNSTPVLEQYATYLEDEGFIVTFGSEHNTPAMEPIRLRTRDAESLSEKLRAVNWRGACRIAAHQKGLHSAEEGEGVIRKALL
ncbi:MAG: PHP domain-containing protein [Bacteroidaceae bacterium]|nr:PHP domain-containing protein [Bacteroidaceae bacterium]